MLAGGRGDRLLANIPEMTMIFTGGQRSAT